MRFGFLVTARCNAACTHCTTSCGPDQTQALPQASIMRLMDEATALWRQRRAPGEGLSFSISGGEPFLDFDQLIAIVGHGHSLGATVSCVTNGSWAASDRAASDKLTRLKQAGLQCLAVSTSQFHQKFVKRSRVERALTFARRLGLRTTLKCAVTSGDAELVRWAEACQVDQREIFPVVPYLREGASLEDSAYLREHGLPEGRCPYPTITVREDGGAYTCCMPGAFTEFLSLGDVHREPLERIYRRFYLNGTQQVLRHRGPVHFARAVIESGLGDRLRSKYESACDLCAHIAADPAMSVIAREAAERFADEQRRRTATRLGHTEACVTQHNSEEDSRCQC